MGVYLNGNKIAQPYLNGKKMNAYLEGNKIWSSNDEDDEFIIEAQEDGQMIIYNKWSQSIIVNTSTSTATVPSYITLNVTAGDLVIVKESVKNYSFRNFIYNQRAFVSGVKSKIISMPPMNRFTDLSGKVAGNSFFSRFNVEGSLTSLPEGSFDISNISVAKGGFFSSFNSIGALTSLPSGSFNISNITTTASTNDFFSRFNIEGSLTNLPEGSFNISNITTHIGNNFFINFNYRGALTRDTTSSNRIVIKNITNQPVTFFYRTGTNTNNSVEILSGNTFDGYLAG